MAYLVLKNERVVKRVCCDIREAVFHACEMKLNHDEGEYWVVEVKSDIYTEFACASKYIVKFKAYSKSNNARVELCDLLYWLEGYKELIVSSISKAGERDAIFGLAGLLDRVNKLILETYN